LLIATTNAGKIREIRELLAGLPIELVTLDALPPIEPPEETGQTFAENARLKASYYAAATGMTVVAEDSGLEIDALGGVPGVESARFGGEGTSYPEKFKLLYQMLNGRPSTARFVCALAVAETDAVETNGPAKAGHYIFEARGTVEGEIAPEPRGEGGFGYDPIFYYPPFGCTLAEAGSRKSSVSHRGNAFRHLRSWLSSQALRSSPPP
jgi:XTP/dITP diphosphohydrolase